MFSSLQTTLIAISSFAYIYLSYHSVTFSSHINSSHCISTQSYPSPEDFYVSSELVSPPSNQSPLVCRPVCYFLLSRSRFSCSSLLREPVSVVMVPRGKHAQTVLPVIVFVWTKVARDFGVDPEDLWIQLRWFSWSWPLLWRLQREMQLLFLHVIQPAAILVNQVHRADEEENIFKNNVNNGTGSYKNQIQFLLFS